MSSSPDRSDQPNRRQFLGTQAALAGAVALGGLSIARSAHAAGSDEIRMALIGCGNRGTGAAVNAIKNKAGAKVKLYAMADAFPDRLSASLAGIARLDDMAGREARSALEKPRPSTRRRVQDAADEIRSKVGDNVDVPASRQFVGMHAFEEALNTDADFVILATPPGFRPQQFEATVAAGKNMFMEKPVATDAVGLRRVIKANEVAKSKGLVVGCGHHLRHETKYREIMKRVHDGDIGKIQYIRVYFNSPGVWNIPRSPEWSEMEYQIRNWYYFTWLSGDHIVEQHVHDLDIGNWAMKDEHPAEAQGAGGRQVRIGPNYGEIFDHHTIEYTYPNGAKMFSFCRHQPNTWESFSEHIHGDRGEAHIDGINEAELIVYGQEPVKWKRGEDGHQLEHDDLFAALLAGEPYTEAPQSISASMTAILGRMASYSGKIANWDECVASELDLTPKVLEFDAETLVKPGPDGIYPCALPGLTQAW